MVVSRLVAGNLLGLVPLGLDLFVTILVNRRDAIAFVVVGGILGVCAVVATHLPVAANVRPRLAFSSRALWQLGLLLFLIQTIHAKDD
jgi:hypothetical protein